MTDNREDVLRESSFPILVRLLLSSWDETNVTNDAGGEEPGRVPSGYPGHAPVRLLDSSAHNNHLIIS